MSQKNRLTARTLAFCLSLLLSHWAFANPMSGAVQEEPSALAMAGDLVLVRPAMFAITVLGTAVWVVGLPFSAAGGNVKGSANTLVIQPAKNTFVRCLGCTRAGYARSIKVVD